MKSLTNETVTELLQEDFENVILSPLSSDYEQEYLSEGFRYRSNVTVLGLVEVRTRRDGMSVSTRFPYGIKDKVFYLGSVIGEKAYVSSS